MQHKSRATETRGAFSVATTENIEAYISICRYFPLCLADKGELGEIWGREGSDVGTGRSNTSNRSLLQKGRQIIFVDLRKNIQD